MDTPAAAGCITVRSKAEPPCRAISAGCPAAGGALGTVSIPVHGGGAQVAAIQLTPAFEVIAALLLVGFAFTQFNALGGSRDMYLTTTGDFVHFSPPQKIGEGTWKLAACPKDGGSLVNDHGRMVSAWRRGPQVFLAEAGHVETSLGEGHDVAMAAGARGAYVM